MTCRIVKKSQGFTDVGLLRISESVRAYAYYLIRPCGPCQVKECKIILEQSRLTGWLAGYSMFHVTWTTFKFNRNQLGTVSAYVMIYVPSSNQRAIKSLEKVILQRVSA